MKNENEKKVSSHNETMDKAYTVFTGTTLSL